MKIFLLLPILTIAIPFIIGGICLIKDHIKTIKKDKAQLEEDKQWFYNKVWNGNWENEGKKIDIRNIPQSPRECSYAYMHSRTYCALFLFCISHRCERVRK